MKNPKETGNVIYCEEQFRVWLAEQNITRPDEVIESLHTLNKHFWAVIGENLKRSAIDPMAVPIVFDFNPSEWISICIRERNQTLLRDIITLYTSLLNRLHEKQNVDEGIIERNIILGYNLNFSEIQVGNYPWSDAVKKAYDRFEKYPPLPSLRMVDKWKKAWPLYVKFIRILCIALRIDADICAADDSDRVYIDPYGGDSRVDDAVDTLFKDAEQKVDTILKRYLKKNGDTAVPLALKLNDDLKSTSVGINKYEAASWLDSGKFHTIYQHYRPFEHSFSDCVMRILKSEPELLDGNDILIIAFVTKDFELDDIRKELSDTDLFSQPQIKVCVVRNLSMVGEGILRIYINYR